MPYSSEDLVAHLLNEEAAREKEKEDANGKDDTVYSRGFIPSLLKGIGEAVYPAIKPAELPAEIVQPTEGPSSTTSANNDTVKVRRLFTGKLFSVKDDGKMSAAASTTRTNQVCPHGASCRITRRSHKMNYRHPPKKYVPKLLMLLALHIEYFLIS